MFAVYCLDKPQTAELRQATRPAHLAYIKVFADNIALAGPIVSDDDESSLGGLLLVRFDSRAEAEAFIRDDPYTKAGLFDSITVKRFRQVVPPP